MENTQVAPELRIPYSAISINRRVAPERRAWFFQSMLHLQALNRASRVTFVP
jgi:hypothetical protein